MRLSKISSRIEGVKDELFQFQLALTDSKTYWIEKSKMTTAPEKGQFLVLSFYLNILAGIELDGKAIYSASREDLLSELSVLSRQLETEIYEEKAAKMKAEVAQTNAELMPILRHRLALFKLSFPRMPEEIWHEETKAYQLAQNLMQADGEHRLNALSIKDAAKFAKRNPNDEVLNYAVGLIRQIEQDLEMFAELNNFDDAVFASKMTFCKTLRTQSLFGAYCSVGQIVRYQQSLSAASQLAAAAV